jgi:hypothetical protein
MSSKVTPIQAVVNYQNSQNARNSDSDAAIDRARGGTIHIRITIPEERIRVTGGIGAVVIPKKEVNVLIDLEQMPLVNVASYKIEQEQIAPAKMSYPYGGDKEDDEENIWAGTFQRA